MAVEANENCRSLLLKIYSKTNQDFASLSELLCEFRVLTRQKNLTSDVLDSKCVKSLIEYSSQGQNEAQKCLSNLILNYPHLRDQIIEPYVDCVDSRLETVLNDRDSMKISSKELCEILHYDLRIVFLLSALCPESRSKMKQRLVLPVLKLTDHEANEVTMENHPVVVESLKTLFNLSLDESLDHELVGSVIIKLFKIVGTDKDELDYSKIESRQDLLDQLLINLIHLLTNMPRDVYLKLSKGDVSKILSHLDDRLKNDSPQDIRESILPVLNVCANICKYNLAERDRLFKEILESSSEFEKRPEEYDTLRGRLVKLMTSIDIHVKDIAAEFLYALCGCDTDKFITYTGFGNSAAFLSTRGLLSESKRRTSSSQDQELSEYEKLRHKIDPMTGKIETPKQDPMKDMTDEEKEYHAHELAKAITKLTNLGVVKPMRVDEDGNMTDIGPDRSDETKHKE